MLKSGIYLIKNKVNNKFYIGSSKDVKRRFFNHISDLNRKDHGNNYLQKAWNKYGKDNFEFIVLEYCDIQVILYREQFYIDSLKPEYNIAQFADDSPMKGRKHSEFTRNKISQTKKSQCLTVSEECRKRISLSSRKPKSKEHIENARLAQVGRKISEKALLNAISSRKKYMKRIVCVNILTNEKFIYDGIGIAARDLKISKQRLRNGLNYGYTIMKKYKFKYMENQ